MVLAQLLPKDRQKAFFLFLYRLELPYLSELPAKVLLPEADGLAI